MDLKKLADIAKVVLAWVAGLGLLAVFFVTLALGLKQERETQERFERNCKVVGKIRGDVSVGTGVTMNGQAGTVVTSTPDKTGYLCPDGITYWR